MDTARPPRNYPEWRTGQYERREDAAYLFGYYLIECCRDEAMATLPEDAPAEVKTAVEEAVDTALHNVCDMLEGFFPMKTGPNHQIELALSVRVVDAEDAENKIIESVEISPCMLDLPIGYWKWARDREFR